MDQNSSGRKRVRVPDERSRKRQALKQSATDVYRRAILDAAERVFTASSVADAKITEIAREAGMATGTLYNYFKSKEQIFESLVETRAEAFLTRLDAVYAEEEDPIGRIQALVQATLGHIEEHRGMFVLFMQLGVRAEWQLRQVTGEAGERRYDQFLRHFERAIRAAVVDEHLRRDLQVGDLVAFLSGAMNGYVRAWMAAGGRRGLAARAGTIVDVFLRGAGSKR